jgi:hypothetical protein
LFRDESDEFDEGLVAFVVVPMGDEALGLIHLVEEVEQFLGLVVALEGKGHGFAF